MKSLADAGVEKTSYERNGNARQDERIQEKMNKVRWTRKDNR
jgi:hypothetical protein